MMYVTTEAAVYAIAGQRYVTTAGITLLKKSAFARGLVLVPVVVALSDALILHHRFSEHRCDRNHSLFVILPVDDDIVLVNIFWLDTAKLQAANPSLKEYRQYRAVTNGLEAVPTAIFHHPLYLFRRKGSNDRLFLFAPDEVSLCVERSITLSIAILDKGLQAFQNAIDVSSLSVTGCEHFYKLSHCR